MRFTTLNLMLVMIICALAVGLAVLSVTKEEHVTFDPLAGNFVWDLDDQILQFLDSEKYANELLTEDDFPRLIALTKQICSELNDNHAETGFSGWHIDEMSYYHLGNEHIDSIFSVWLRGFEHEPKIKTLSVPEQSVELIFITDSLIYLNARNCSQETRKILLSINGVTEPKIAGQKFHHSD